MTRTEKVLLTVSAIIALVICSVPTKSADEAAPIAAIAMLQCDHLKSLYIVRDAGHATQYTAGHTIEFTFAEDGSRDAKSSDAIAIGAAVAAARSARIKLTYTAICGSDDHEIFPGQLKTTI